MSGAESEPGHALASVFEPDHDGPRGPNLRVSVEVPRAALGAGFRAPVPERLAADGDLITRVVNPGDTPGFVVLHLPEALPDRAVLRLRGQGGVGQADQRPGDLLVVVELVDRAPRGDERIVASPGGSAAVAHRDHDGLARVEGLDATVWVLAGLAVVSAAVLGLLYLL